MNPLPDQCRQFDLTTNDAPPFLLFVWRMWILAGIITAIFSVKPAVEWLLKVVGG